MAGTLTHTLYNVIDRIFIGQGVSALALSGLALTFPFVSIMSAFSMLVSIGAASVASIFLGSKDRSLRLILPNTLFLSFLAYVLVTVVCMVSLNKILTLFGGTPNTLPYAREYLTIIIPGHIFTSLSYTLSNLIRSSGHPFRAMNVLILGFGLNILLDPLFIFILGMGIRGAAIGTVVSMAISTLWGLLFFWKQTRVRLFRGLEISNECDLSFNNSTFRFDYSLIGKMLSIGFSPFLLQFCNSLVLVVMNSSLLAYGGDLALAAYGIITSFTAIVTTAVTGFSHGLQPIIGYNHGAGLHDRVLTTLHKGILYASLITVAGWLIAMLIPVPIARCFVSDNTVLIGMAANGLRCSCLMLGLMGFHIVVTLYYQSIGRADISVILTFSRQVLFLISFILLLPQLLNPVTSYLNAIWLAQPASTICSVVMAALILRKTYIIRYSDDKITT